MVQDVFSCTQISTTALLQNHPVSVLWHRGGRLCTEMGSYAVELVDLSKPQRLYIGTSSLYQAIEKGRSPGNRPSSGGLVGNDFDLITLYIDDCQVGLS